MTGHHPEALFHAIVSITRHGSTNTASTDTYRRPWAQGYVNVAEVIGGFAGWSAKFRPNGERRAESGGWMSADGREELFGTGG